MYPNNLLDIIIRKKNPELRINGIPTLPNESRETKLRSLPNNHFTKGFQNRFKDLGFQVTYKTKLTVIKIITAKAVS